MRPVPDAPMPSSRIRARRAGDPSCHPASPIPLRLPRLLPCLLAVVALLLCASPHARAEDAEHMDRETRRRELARHFDIYDFEPRGNDLNSRDLDGDGFPDFWEPLIDDVHRDYLADQIRIVPDPERPPAIPGAPGHALRIPFDGTGVAIQTRFPRIVDPDLAYEISAWGRSERLTRSRVLIHAIWLHEDPVHGEREVGLHTMQLPPGQVDWVEAPMRLRVNDIPTRANRLRIRLEILPDPAFRGSDRNGAAYIDDIRIETRPKIKLDPLVAFRSPGQTDAVSLSMPVTYQGFDRPDPDAPAGARYFRIVRIHDIYGQPPEAPPGSPPPLDTGSRRDIHPGPMQNMQETLTVRLHRTGIHYVSVALFETSGTRLAEVTQVLALLPPPPPPRDVTMLTGEQNDFGILMRSTPPDSPKGTDDLARMLQHTNIAAFAAFAFPVNANGGRRTPNPRIWVEPMRSIRGRGITVQALLHADTPELRALPVQDSMTRHLEAFRPLIRNATQSLDPFVDTWQWGHPEDASLSRLPDPAPLTDAMRDLRRMTSSTRQSFPFSFEREEGIWPAPGLVQAVNAYVPSTVPPQILPRLIAQARPERLAHLGDPDALLYPPRYLQRLAPPPRPGDVTFGAPPPRQDAWLTLRLRPVPSYTRMPRPERLMLEDMAQKAILARALGIDRIYIDSFDDPGAGLVERRENGDWIPRPAFLGLRVLSDQLSGSRYLGSFLFHSEEGAFHNYVFAHRNGRDTVTAIWFDGDGDGAEVDYGGGVNPQILDLEGNTMPMPPSGRFFATRIPQLIHDTSIPLARTRMSLTLLPDPALAMRDRFQPQRLSIRNFYRLPIAGSIRLEYAADRDYVFEPNWHVRPGQIPFNIGMARGTPPNLEYPLHILPFQVRPSANSSADTEGILGRKYVQVTVDMRAEAPIQLRLLRLVELTGDLDVRLRRLEDTDDPGTDVIQMLVRWLPEGPDQREAQIVLRPYYRRAGGMNIELPDQVIPNYSQMDPDAPPVNIEFRIPRPMERTETWIGYRQEGGARFYNHDVTRLTTPMRQ